MRDIENYCYQQFTISRQQNLALHDIDIQSWAVERANEHEFDF